MPALKKRRGFSLIELLVAISIIAVISIVGFSMFSQAQMRGRDAKRKQDLRSVALALDIYKQKNGRYPCGGWQMSSSSGWTINDNQTAGMPPCDTAGEVIAGGLNSTYINTIPKDPLETGAGNPWDGTNPNTSYHYGLHTQCSTTAQFFVLIAQLENKSDPERLGLNPKIWCTGVDITTVGFNSPTSFIITSE